MGFKALLAAGIPPPSIEKEILPETELPTDQDLSQFIADGGITIEPVGSKKSDEDIAIFTDGSCLFSHGECAAVVYERRRNVSWGGNGGRSGVTTLSTIRFPLYQLHNGVGRSNPGNYSD